LLFASRSKPSITFSIDITDPYIEGGMTGLVTAKQLARIMRVILYFERDKLNCLAKEIHISSP